MAIYPKPKPTKYRKGQRVRTEFGEGIINSTKHPYGLGEWAFVIPDDEEGVSLWFHQDDLEPIE